MREPAYGVIDEMLPADLSAPRMQKHTTARIYQRLITEHGFTAGRTVVTSTSLVGGRSWSLSYAREQRHLQGMVPQQHQPGDFPTLGEHPVPLASRLTRRACS